MEISCNVGDIKKCILALWNSSFHTDNISAWLHKTAELRDKNQELTEQIKKMNIENALLLEELARVQNDPVYQEKIARQKMGVVRKGEIPIKVVPFEKEKR